jgi:hypothetical protein
MASKSGVDISGLAETLRALKIIDPTVRKESLKPISAVGRDIVKLTKARVPNSPARNWGAWQPRGRGSSAKLGPRAGFADNGPTYRSNPGRLGWNASEVKAGVRYLGGGERMNIRLVNRSAAGGVFETAGQQGNYSTPQGAVFARNLDRFGVAPRGLIKTWRNEKGVTRFASAIKKATLIAEAKVNEVVR